jgi:hypothetical protein
MGVNMGLREFLEQHPAAGASEGSAHSQIATWRTAVSALIARFKAVLGAYGQLSLTEWNVLRDHAGIRYNADALTIEHGDNAITLEPSAIGPAPGVLGRASLNCGVREVHLDCATDGRLWSFHWVVPHDQAVRELTDQTIETLVEDLLRSSEP